MTDETSKPKLELVGERNPLDVFSDLDALRKKSKLTIRRQPVLINVSVDRPPNNVYFRTNPKPGMILDDASVIADERKTFYFVTPEMSAHPKLAQRVRRVTLRLTYLWPTDLIMLWPVAILGDRDFAVWKSARIASELAEEKWTQIVWNEARRDYDVETAEGINVDPRWPDKSLSELLSLAFADKVIDTEDHPYARRLRGLDD